MHMFQQKRIAGDFVQPPNSANIRKNAFGINLLINVQRPSITLQMGDICFMIMLFAVKKMIDILFIIR